MNLHGRRLLHPRQGVGTRGAGASEGGAAHSRRPAVVKGELGRGAPTSAAGFQNTSEPSGEQASALAGRSPASLGHAGPLGAARAHSHCRRLRLEPRGHPTLPLPLLPLCSQRLRSPPRCPGSRWSPPTLWELRFWPQPAASGGISLQESATSLLQQPAAQVEIAGISVRRTRWDLGVTRAPRETDRSGCHLPPAPPQAGPSSYCWTLWLANCE